jgi:uncharacterized membrane protein
MADEVNADLWRDNRRRWKISILLIAISVVVAFVMAGLRPTGLVKNVFVGGAMAFFIAGIVGLRWAGQQAYFLRRPEPKDPPSLWKFR